MLIDKFMRFILMLDEAISTFLPADLVTWLGALVMVIFVLAVWRMIH